MIYPNCPLLASNEHVWHICEQLSSKIKHAKSTLYFQLSNHHLFDVILLSTSSFLILHLCVIANKIRCLVNKLWLLLCEFSCFLVPELFLVKLCGSWAEKVKDPDSKAYPHAPNDLLFNLMLIKLNHKSQNV